MIDGAEIRRATPDDLEEVVELLAAQLAEHHIPFARADLAFAAEAIPRVAERGLVLLAVDGAGAVGVACVSYSSTVERGGLVAGRAVRGPHAPRARHGQRAAGGGDRGGEPRGVPRD
ncbi:MAG: hypothetical protein KY467_15380 [Gemmatimonadetes bacterium]|nr:hypothetical protein [Gemmatimonadota bacterium]